MSRKWIAPAVLRLRQGQQRQEEAHGDDEAAASDRAQYLMDEGNNAQDEEAIANAPAFHIGHVGDLYIYRAEQPTKCQRCGLEIAAGELFNSVSDVLTIAHRLPMCEACRPSTRKRTLPVSQVNNPHMVAARMKKAEAIIAILQKHSITAEQAEGMTDRQWAIAAKAATVNAPSVDTQRLVVDALRRSERKTA